MNPDLHPAADLSDALIDGAARASTQALHRAGQAAEQTVEAMTERVERHRSRVRPALHDLAGGVEDLARHGAQALRGRAQRARDTGSDYIQERPLPALLMAVAGGAALALLAGWLLRSTDSRR